MPRFVARSIYRAFLRSLPAEQALTLQFWRAHGSRPDFRAPKTFSEKLQHRKLYESDRRFVAFANKIAVKAFVRERLGKDWITPTLWSGKSLPRVEERTWPVPFVVKANHASGWNLFVRSEAERHWPAIEALCARWMRTPYLPHLGENFYNEIDREVLVEPLIGSAGHVPTDYKFFVFSGRTAFIQVDTDREIAHRRVFYDRDWNRQTFTFRYPLEPRAIPRPRHFQEMIGAAESLGEGFSFVRIDLYDLGDGPRFGEMTFVPESGFARFSPESVDALFGDLWP